MGASKHGEPFAAIVSRRGLLHAAGGLAAAAFLPRFPARAQSVGQPRLDFSDLPLKVIKDIAVADGYDAQILIRWGDPVMAGAPAFDPQELNASAQSLQFGANNDFIAYFPLPFGSQSSEHGVLLVNHEYTTLAAAFPGVTDWALLSAEQAATDMAAVGVSVIEVRKENGHWRTLPGGRFSRRITATTPISLSGPAAGHPRMRTEADPTGRLVLGTIANCAGGKTPWGTALVGEENFHYYFRGEPVIGDPERNSLMRAGIDGKPNRAWGKYDRRWDITHHPREANRFGWIVEIDPYNPHAQPIKRTHLGRFRHEAASVAVNRDGRVVVYLGDDRDGGCIYRFISRARYRTGMSRARAGALLDEGVLYAARFDAVGLDWLALHPGVGPLKDFKTLGDVMIDASHAAELVGATPMDRPEDIEVNPLTGRIYVNLTGNEDRLASKTDGPNPRGPNLDGQILELTPFAGDHTATRFAWSLLMICGPKESGARYGAGTNTVLSAPDNIAFDGRGRLWIATDGERWKDKKAPIPNGLYACAVDGPARAQVKFFFNVPKGAELTGPEFTPNGETLFVAVQHPGESDDGSGQHWPDRKAGMPPRDSVVAITRKSGGLIGG
jgi:secreted PhoX family phosphatase